MADVIVPPDAVSSGRITLTPNAVSTVTFAGSIQAVQIWHNGNVPVYVTTDGSTPTIDGQQCYEVPPGMVGEYRTPDLDADVVKLRCAEAATVRVERA